jgi:phage portal protein BeeE
VNLPTLRRRSKVEERDSFPAITINDWLGMIGQFTYQGNSYTSVPTPSLAGPSETMESNFRAYVEQAYKSCGVVFACMAVRSSLFSEARFQFRRMRQGRPGDLWGSDALTLLETPWPNGTTRDLLTRMIQDNDLAGNFYGLRQGNRIRRLRPDWVDIVLGGDEIGDLNSDVIGYAYWPGGQRKGKKPILLDVPQVAHWAPKPDPTATYRGMSWLTPVINEIIADKGMTRHKQKFLDNGATPSMVGTLAGMTNQDDFDRWVARFRERQEGVENAYKTMWLGAGSDMKVVGANFQEIDFKVVQGAGETRIAAAAEVPPIIVGLNDGLSSATYSNYAQAMRRFTDLTMRTLWGGAAAALAPIIDVPSDSILWYDARDIAALSEDADKQAAIDGQKATTLHILISAGFDPASAVAQIAPDWSQLEHTGMYSVQLQPAGTVTQGKGSLVVGTPVPSGQPKQLPPGSPGDPAALEGKSGANGAAMTRQEAERMLAQFTAKGEQ